MNFLHIQHCSMEGCCEVQDSFRNNIRKSFGIVAEEDVLGWSAQCTVSHCRFWL